MNKPLFAAGSIITTMTAVAIGSVGETSSCGEVTSWTVPVTIFFSMAIPSVLAYFAGRGNRADREALRDQLVDMHAAFDAELPSTVGSAFQLASHYYNLVVAAKPKLRTAIEKLSK